MLFADAVLAQCQRSLDRFGESFAQHQQVVREFSSPAYQLLRGGKRFRARLADAAWRAFGGCAADPAIVHAGAALELFQAAALIHDDVVDDADTRRGQPAAHRQFAQLDNLEDSESQRLAFGKSAAILLGDLLLALSQQQMDAAALLSPTGAGAAAIYQDMTAEVAFGQFLDIRAALHPTQEDTATAMAVVQHKSARYSVERPLSLGAALAGADPAQISLLARFGLPLGEAFQLRDDDLGVFGDPAVTGKPAGDDIAEGKRTVLILLGLQLASQSDAAYIRSQLGNRSITDCEVERIRHILTSSGARARHESLISERHDAALSALDHVEIPPAAVEELRQYARQLTARQF